MKLNIEYESWYLLYWICAAERRDFFFCRGGEVFAALFRYFCKCCLSVCQIALFIIFRKQ